MLTGEMLKREGEGSGEVTNRSTVKMALLTEPGHLERGGAPQEKPAMARRLVLGSQLSAHRWYS